MKIPQLTIILSIITSLASVGYGSCGADSSLYSKSRVDLLKVSAKTIAQETELLGDCYESDQAQLKDLQSDNAALCVRLARLHKECIAMNYIADAYGLDDLGCDSTGSSDSNRFEVVISTGKRGGSFKLVANDNYVSNELHEGTNTVEFKRTDYRLVKPPRFRDLITLDIVAIRSGGSLGERATRPLEMQISFLVNGKPLLDDFSLLEPQDKHDISSYRINPNGLVELKSKAECLVELSEIQQIMSR